ncbi:MAG: Oxygen-independent coproporphyrinogen oxidase [Pseudomonadota bacterium]
MRLEPQTTQGAAARARYARQAAPRYTSYPTAPHFAKRFPETVSRDWLAGLDPATPLSLYAHIPFCQQMCWYCGCNMKLAARYAPVTSYVDSLLAEINLVAAALPARMRAARLHFGGGTPTALKPDDLSRLVGRFRERFNLAADAELAIETDPRTITDAMIARIGALGFTRASLGVQEFDPRVQAAINRIQPAALVESVTEKLRAAGIARLNFDLIYGLPQQTVSALCKTVAECMAMKPDRISLFGYAHVPWMARNQRMIDEDALPGPQDRAAQARSAAAALVARGYRQIGIDHFAVPTDSLALAAEAGRLHRNFQGYTDDAAETLLGFGVTAIGRTPFGYVQNEAETGRWSRAIHAGHLPVAKGHALSLDDRLRGHVIERIMCDGAIDLDEAGRIFGSDAQWWRTEIPALDSLQHDGLLRRTDARIILTPEGVTLARIVASTFDTYLTRGQARHSIVL